MSSCTAKLRHRPDPFDSTTSGVDALGQVWRLHNWFAPYRMRMGAAVLVALVSAAAAVLAPVVFSRVVVDEILIGKRQANAPDFNQSVLTHWLVGTLGIEPLTAAGAIYLSWIVLWASCGYVFRSQLSSTVQAGLADLRRDLFAHVERLPATFHDRAKVGQLLTRITNDIESLAEILTSFGALAGDLLPVLAAVTVMFSLDATLTLDLSPVILLIAGAGWVFRTLARPIYRSIRDTQTRLGEYLYENVAGIEEVQAYSREALNLRRFAALNDEGRSFEIRATRIETSYFPLIENIPFLLIACVLWLGGGHVLNHVATLGSIVLFLQFTEMMLRPVVALCLQVGTISRASAACGRIVRLLDWRESLDMPAQPTPLPRKLRGHIEFRGMTFCYHDGTPIIRQLNLEIRPGENVAIVGPTGSGKTTLTRLICRHYDVPPASLFIDGIDVMQMDPTELRKRIGTILQEFHLFPGTVYDNIAMGNPAVTREHARCAAELVQALDFIEALPESFDTVLEDRGQSLSQGQRQLLAFARIVALNPDILILDEATANVDLATESAIQSGLSRIISNRTSIIIAHRLQSIRDVDRIIVLHRGEVVEAGTHGELLKRNGMYNSLHDAQGAA